jgi:hypothetical protein
MFYIDMKFFILRKGENLRLCVSSAGHQDKRRPRRIIRHHVGLARNKGEIRGVKKEYIMNDKIFR